MRLFVLGPFLKNTPNSNRSKSSANNGFSLSHFERVSSRKKTSIKQSESSSALQDIILFGDCDVVSLKDLELQSHSFDLEIWKVLSLLGSKYEDLEPRRERLSKYFRRTMSPFVSNWEFGRLEKYKERPKSIQEARSKGINGRKR